MLGGDHLHAALQDQTGTGQKIGAHGNGSFLEAAWADEPRDAGPMQQSADDHEDTYGDSKDTGDHSCQLETHVCSQFRWLARSCGRWSCWSG